jgi:hypothetical protein
MGDKNRYIERQTTQWPKEKVHKDKQRSRKHTQKTKDRANVTFKSLYLRNAVEFYHRIFDIIFFLKK